MQDWLPHRLFLEDDVQENPVENALDPGLLVPQSVVQRSLRKDLPVVLRNVRQRIYDLRAENAPEVAVR